MELRIFISAMIYIGLTDNIVSSKGGIIYSCMRNGSAVCYSL
jgi:hypothetical protein